MSKLFDYVTDKVWISQQPESYSDLQEGFYYKDDVLSVYTYLANLDLGLDIETVYIHITDGGAPQLWVEIGDEYATIGNIFEFGSNSDPAPTMVKSKRAVTDSAYANTKSVKNLITMGSTNAIAESWITNCYFTEGAFGSSPSKIYDDDEVIYENCYFIPDANKSIHITNAVFVGNVVITTEHPTIGIDVETTHVGLSVKNCEFHEAKFYLGGNITIEWPLIFKDSVQSDYTDPITRLPINEPTYPNISMLARPFDCSATKNIPRKFVPHTGTTVALKATNTEFSDITLLASAITDFTQCKFVNKSKPIDIHYAYLDECRFIDTPSSQPPITMKNSFIKHSSFECNVGNCSNNYYGVGNVFKLATIPHELPFASVACHILCEELEYHTTGGVPMSYQTITDMMSANAGIFDLSVIESDKIMCRIAKGLIKLPHIAEKLFGYDFTLRYDELMLLVAELYKHAGHEDKSELITHANKLVLNMINHAEPCMKKGI